MSKRYIPTEQLRNIVRARRTKGQAFLLKHDEYETRQESIKAELAALTREEIFAKYPSCTSDMK